MADSTSDRVWNVLFNNTLYPSDPQQLNQMVNPTSLASDQVWFSDVETNNLQLSPMGESHQSQLVKVEDSLASPRSELFSSPPELDIHISPIEFFNKLQRVEDKIIELQYE